MNLRTKSFLLALSLTAISNSWQGTVAQESKDEWILELSPPILIEDGGLRAANTKAIPHPAYIQGKIAQKGSKVNGTLGYGTHGGCGTPGPHYDGPIKGTVKDKKATLLWTIGMGEYYLDGTYDPQSSRYSGKYESTVASLEGSSKHSGTFVLRHRPWDDNDFLRFYYDALSKGKNLAYQKFGSGDMPALNQSLADLKTAIDWANKLSTDKKAHLQALAYGNLGYCYAGTGDRKLAIENYRKAQEYEEQYLKSKSWADPITLKLIKDSISSLSSQNNKIKSYILN